MKTGDEVLLYLKTEIIPTFPVRIIAKVDSVNTIAEVTTYVFSYDEVQLTGSGVVQLDQSFVKDFPVCYGIIDKLTDRVKLLEDAVFPP
jgi:hypothetical protein